MEAILVVCSVLCNVNVCNVRAWSKEWKFPLWKLASGNFSKFPLKCPNGELFKFTEISIVHFGNFHSLAWRSGVLLLVRDRVFLHPLLSKIYPKFFHSPLSATEYYIFTLTDNVALGPVTIILRV